MKKPEDMTPQEIKDEIFDLQSQIGTRQVRLGVLCLRLALDACPYQVGEVLINQHGERARIDDIRAPSIYGGGFGKGYRMVGVYLKKDGTPAMNPGRDNQRPRACLFYDWEDWKKKY